MCSTCRYHIELRTNPLVDYTSYYGPRPIIVFRNNVYVPDQNAEGENEMEVYDMKYVSFGILVVCDSLCHIIILSKWTFLLSNFLNRIQ